MSEDYKVEWEIDEAADSPLEAAKQARNRQYAGTSANVFTVIDSEGEHHVVDHEELDCDPLPAPERKVIRMVIEVSGGIVQSVTGDCEPAGVEIDLYVVDHDNISDRPAGEEAEQGEVLLEEFSELPHKVYL